MVAVGEDRAVDRLGQVAGVLERHEQVVAGMQHQRGHVDRRQDVADIDVGVLLHRRVQLSRRAGKSREPVAPAQVALVTHLRRCQQRYGDGVGVAPVLGPLPAQLEHPLPGYPDLVVIRVDQAGEGALQDQPLGALRVGRSEQAGERASLREPPDGGALPAHGVHDDVDVLHSLVHRRGARPTRRPGRRSTPRPVPVRTASRGSPCRPSFASTGSLPDHQDMLLRRPRSRARFGDPGHAGVVLRAFPNDGHAHARIAGQDLHIRSRRPRTHLRRSGTPLSAA